MEASDLAFTLAKVETGLPLMRYPWTPKYNADPPHTPAKGLPKEMTYEPTETMVDVKDMELIDN